MRVAITGASGFIGARLAYELRTKHTLIPLARTVTHNVESFNMADPAKLRQKLECLHADVVIHAGAMARRRECNAWPARASIINVNATAIIAEWAAARSVPMIFLSTVGVHEDNVYANTKRMAEQCVQASGVKACILRLAYTFGWSPSLSRPGPQQRLEAEAVTPGSQAFDDSWKFQPTSLTHLCRIIEAILVRLDAFPSMTNVVAPYLVTMYGLASSCLPHEVQKSVELNERVQNFVETKGSVADDLPMCTMEALADELREALNHAVFSRSFIL